MIHFHKVPGRNEAAAVARRAHRYRRHLAQSIVFEEGGVTPLARAAVFTSAAVTIGLIAWAGLTQVKEVAVTNGVVVPISAIRTIQHLEGGIVQQILVREGQLVEAGEELMLLDETQARSELEQLKAREIGLRLRAERLRAYAERRAPDFPMLKGRAFGQERDQAVIYEAQEKSRDDVVSVLSKQTAQRKADIAVYQKQIASLTEQIEFIGSEEGIRRELFEKGLNSKLIYLQIRREAARLKGERARLQSQMATAVQALAESEHKLAEQRSRLAQEALNEMGTVTAELAQLQEARAKAEDRVNRLIVAAPVRGLVQEVKITGVGAVIPPGGDIMKIVPTDDVLQIETRIQPRDVGHVQIGQPVTVKVSSYDFARFGAVNGDLEQVSASTFLDEEKKPYYKGWVKLDHPYVGHERYRILPGMTVQADIVTGEKTVLEYLLKPVVLAYTQAMHER